MIIPKLQTLLRQVKVNFHLQTPVLDAEITVLSESSELSMILSVKPGVGQNNITLLALPAATNLVCPANFHIPTTFTFLSFFFFFFFFFFLQQGTDDVEIKALPTCYFPTCYFPISFSLFPNPLLFLACIMCR